MRLGWEQATVPPPPPLRRPFPKVRATRDIPMKAQPVQMRVWQQRGQSRCRDCSRQAPHRAILALGGFPHFFQPCVRKDLISTD